MQAMTWQYYNFINLFKKTHRLSKNPAVYQGLNLEDYHRKIAIVGTVGEMMVEPR